MTHMIVWHFKNLYLNTCCGRDSEARVLKRTKTGTFRTWKLNTEKLPSQPVNSNPRPPSKSWKYKKDQNLKRELLAHFKCNLVLQHKKILRAVLFPMDNEITDFCYCCCYYFIIHQLIDHSVKCQNTDGYKVGLLCNIRMNKQWCFSYISYITTSH